MAKNYEYKKATIADIDELVRTRIIVLRTANKLSNDVDMSLVEKESYEYYKNALETGEHIAYLVYDNETFIGAGGVSFYRVMPTYHNPTGKKAYIMNMYTAPAYRRQGIAFHTLDLLVKVIRKQGVSQITLEATEMGRPLYEKYGFVKMEDEMEKVDKPRITKAESWKEFNATRKNISIQPVKEGQEVLIMIGAGLKQEKIEECLERHCTEGFEK